MAYYILHIVHSHSEKVLNVLKLRIEFVLRLKITTPIFLASVYTVTESSMLLAAPISTFHELNEYILYSELNSIFSSLRSVGFSWQDGQDFDNISTLPFNRWDSLRFDMEEILPWSWPELHKYVFVFVVPREIQQRP